MLMHMVLRIYPLCALIEEFAPNRVNTLIETANDEVKNVPLQAFRN